MIIIEIPYAPVNLMIFAGDQERAAFDLKVKHQFPEWEGSEDADGMHFHNHIFVESLDEKGILLHELFHFLEWLFGYMEIGEESEFKACISSVLLNQIFFKEGIYEL